MSVSDPRSSRSRARLAVFDLVGTTVQAGDEVPSSFREGLRSVGIFVSDDAIARIRGRSKRDAISDLLSERQKGNAGGREEIERVYARFQGALRAAYRARARAISGVEDVFRFLRGEGVEVVLTTGLDRETARILVSGLAWEPLGLGGLVTGDEVSRGRPAPDLIHAAMSLAGIDDAGSVVVVGDTVSDLEAAAAAEVGWSVGVLSGAHSRSQLGAHPHSVILESVQSLPRWLKEIGALEEVV